MNDSQDSELPVISAEIVPSNQNPAPRFRWTIKTQLLVMLVAGIVLGAFVLGHNRGQRSAPSGDQADGAGGPTTWTCSMHPQVQMPRPGKCPICFMDLIPLSKTVDKGPRVLTMTPAAMALAEIETTPVRRQFVTNEIRMVGKVDFDETRMANITAWIPGRIERMWIDYTGVAVKDGEHLFEIYSPDLVIAQEELLQAARDLSRSPQSASYQRRVRLSEEKLALWGLLPKQIDEIKSRGKASDHVTIYSPAGGIVIHKHVNEGMYVKTGGQIYTIADLTQVWVYLDAYESDVPWLRYGQQVEFTTETYPGEIFEGRIAFIDPMLNEKTRTVKIRVNVANKDLRLKPGMFVRALVKSRVAEGGQVIDEGMAGKWVSPHHPEIVEDGPGKCPICGIDLVPAEQLGFVRGDAGAEPPLVIPASAPLLTGRRAVVYVRLPDHKEPTFDGREILLGHRAGNFYTVRHGLAEGELVVTSGNFKLDSALQISAKPSMMSPEGGAPGGHRHAGPGTKAESSHEHASAEFEVPAEFRVELEPVYEAYLTASNALANDDLAAARKALAQLERAAARIDIQPLEEAGRGRWKTVSDSIVFAAHEAAEAEDRAASRQRFHDVSLAVASMVQTFGHARAAPIYQFRCPMAMESKGASWLQETPQVRNPYFGPAMLTCGDALATFHPQGPLRVTDVFRDQLAGVLDAYLLLQVALAADQPKEAGRAAAALRAAITALDDSDQDPRTRQSWALTKKQLLLALWGEPSRVTIDDMRKRFEMISLAMLASMDSFGYRGERPLVKAYCPMALDNKGAAWIQPAGDIANPYFGAEMLRCGSVKRKFEAKK